MSRPSSRRRFVASTLALTAAPALHIRAAAAADKPLLLRCSLETPPTDTRNAVMRDYLGKLEAAAGGRIKAQLTESDQYFPAAQVTKALLQGQIEMALPATAALAGVVPDAGFFQLPALYGRDIEGVRRVADGKAGQLLAPQIEQQLHAHVIGPWLELGFFTWFSTNRPLTSYADLKGMKIRNGGGAGQAWRTEFMGGVPSMASLPNVPMVLAQGLCDGLIATHDMVANGRLWDAGIGYAFEDGQFAGGYIPVVSRAFWQRLAPDLRQVVTGTWRENVGRYRAEMAAAQARARDLVQAHGIKIAQPSPPALWAMRDGMMARQDEIMKLSRISVEMAAAVSADLAALD